MNTRTRPCRYRLSVLALTAVATLAAADPPPEVEVVRPVVREVSAYADYRGRTESAVVQLKARVTGHLTRVLCEEGAAVKKGDLLFEIDSRPYRARHDRAEAAVALAEAQLRRVEAEYRRLRLLVERKAATAEDLDRATAEREEARVRIAAARAERDIAALALEYTRVSAPFDGRIGRRLLEPGGLARADETDLATLTSVRPMHVAFDIDERTFLGLLRGAGTGKEKVKGTRVMVGLADEDGCPHQAEVSYADARVNPETATIRLRAALPNPDGRLIPGLSARVRLTTGLPSRAVLIPARSVEQTLIKVGQVAAPGLVLVVNQRDEVQRREVRLGQRYGSLVVVKEGLATDDRVVLAGPGRLKVGATVQPKVVAVPGDGR